MLNRTTFFVHNQMICSVSDLTIIGQHNVENACAAITAVLSFTSSWSAIARGLKILRAYRIA